MPTNPTQPRPRSWKFGAVLFIPISIILLAFLVVACSGPPKAQITASATSGPAPLNITFTNKSKGATEFRWDFGEGNTTTTTTVKETVAHEYTKSGTYTVSLAAIRAKDPAQSSTATVTVTVEPGPLSKVALDVPQITLAPGEQQGLSVRALDQFDNPIPGLSYAFRPDDGVGLINTEGVLTAGTRVGTYEKGVTVEVTQGSVSKTATAQLTINPGPLDRVLLEPGTVTLDIGQKQSFKASLVDAYGNPIPEAKIAWKMTDGVGAIDDNGLLTAGTKAGSFPRGLKVTATMGGVSKEATASVIVKPGPADALAISPVTVMAGAARQLQALVTDRYGNSLREAQVSWTVRDANAGSISSVGLLTSGPVAGSYSGAIEAQLTEAGLNRSAKATVTVLPGPLEQVAIAPNPIAIGMGMTQQFVAVGADKYGNRVRGLNFTWSTAAGGGAGAIDAKGLFTAGTKPGTYNKTVTATATQGHITRSASASVTVEPDRIAFIATGQDELDDIYVMNADGTNIQRLTNTPSVKATAAWSPDGRRLLYDAIDDYTEDILVIGMADDGTWPVVVLDAPALFPEWSPDGKYIVATYLTGANSGRIAVMEGDGSTGKDLTEGKNYYDLTPSWSPDGKQIVFISDRDGNSEVYIMSQDGSNQMRLTATPGDEATPRWSPEGAEILFTSDRDGDFEVYIMRLDGSDVRQLTSNAIDDITAVWSADGQRIVFAAESDPDSMDIYSMNRDGSNLTRLTNKGYNVRPSWAPRKRGVEVSEASVVIPNASALRPLTVQEVTAKVRTAVVRINTNLGSGSGFIVDPSGLILTNNHVISGAKEITVFLADGASYKGAVRGRDLLRDLAVVTIKASNLPYLELGDVSQMALGSDLLVIGYPLGSTDITVTRGVASTVKVDTGTNTLLVQTDSAMNPGNSGGPLLNLQGQVIGVVSGRLKGSNVENIGFAISANTVKTYLARLKEGKVIWA